LDIDMPSPQQRAVQNYRARLVEKGLMRFEVLGRSTDRELIRSLAKRLAEGSLQEQAVRAALAAHAAGEHPGHDNILSALRASPLVGADVEFSRSREIGREVDL